MVIIFGGVSCMYVLVCVWVRVPCMQLPQGRVVNENNNTVTRAALVKLVQCLKGRVHLFAHSSTLWGACRSVAIDGIKNPFIVSLASSTGTTSLLIKTKRGLNCQLTDWSSHDLSLLLVWRDRPVHVHPVCLFLTSMLGRVGAGSFVPCSSTDMHSDIHPFYVLGR